MRLVSFYDLINCHVLLRSADQHVQINIGAAQIENSSSEKLLGVTTDAKLKF